MITRINEIYENDEILEDLSKCIFVVRPKKPGTNECDLYKANSLMSYITKLMVRARNRIKS